MIRQPGSDEYLQVCRLLYMSGPPVFNYFFASDSEEEVCRYLHMLYRQPETAFSRDYILVHEDRGDIHGAVLGLPGRDKERLEKNIGNHGKEIAKLAGVVKIFIMMLHGRLARHLAVINDDEYYIGNLAVRNDRRGENIGPMLLDGISGVALARGYGKLSLLVDVRNDHARHVYDKYGFTATMRVDLPARYNRHDLYGFYKVVKKIK